MKKQLTIRRAQANLLDATLLRDTESHSLGDSDYTSQEILAVLQRPEHVAYLACKSGSRKAPPMIVGFCSCFYTALQEPVICLEIDMLGVRPTYRKQGIATQLIRTAIANATALGVCQMRAVVAEDNVASQRAFTRAGMVRTLPLRKMLVHELDGLDALCQDGPRRVSGGGLVRGPEIAATRGECHGLLDRHGARGLCLAVHTLAYRGLWIESIQADSPRLAKKLAITLAHCAKDRSFDEVGYLASANEPKTITALSSAGYREVGSYWIYRADPASAK